MIKSIILTREIIITVGVLTAVGTILGTYLLKRLKKARIPTEWQEVGEVTRLRLFPLKSAKCLELQEAEVTKKGLRENEKVDKSFRLRDSLFRNEELPCNDCGDEPAEWVSKYLLEKDSGLRLGFHDGSKVRDITKVYQDFIDYSKELDNDSTGINSDLAALHLINQASLDDLNKRIPSEAELKVSIENFRPNILIYGPNLKPYVEDNWTFIKIGDVIVRNVFDCVRCLMTTNNQLKGERRKDREPLKTLENYRIGKGPENGPVLGRFLKVLKTGNISVGDKVYIGK